MVCSCEDFCKCEEKCTCRVVCNICNTALQQNLCNHLLPLCKANPRNSKNGALLCEHCTLKNDVIRNESVTSCLIAEEQDSKCCTKLQNNESKKCFIQSSSSNNSLSDMKQSSVSKNEYPKISTQEQQGTWHFSALKTKMRKFRSRIRRTKKKSNDSRHIFLVLDEGSEASDELSVETDLSTDEGYSPVKKAQPLVSTANASSDNLHVPCHKVENFSNPSKNIYRNVPTESFSTISNDECDSFFNKELKDNSGIHFDGDETSKEYSLCSKDFFHSSVTSLHSNAFLTTEQSSEDVVLMNEYDDIESSEVAKHKNVENQKCPILRQFSDDFVSNKATLYVGSDKSWSSSDENPLYSTYPDMAFSQSSSNPDRRFLSTAVVKEKKKFERCTSSDNLLKSTQVTNSKSPSASSNESFATSIHSLFTSQKLKQNRRSVSLSQIPLVAFKPRFLSTLSLITHPRSFSERLRQGSPSLNDSQEKNTESSTLLYESSDLDDFVNPNKAPADLSESESISSSEFLPCKYCRSVSHCPLITDSVIPYHPLE